MPVPAGGTSSQESGRLVGPDEAYRVVFLRDGRARARGYPVPLFADDGGSIPADVLTTTGEDIPDSTLIVDVHSRIPLFQYPPGTDVVYTSINGGPIVPLYARVDDRIDKLADSVADVGDVVELAVATEAANRAAAISAAVTAEQSARVAGDNALSSRVFGLESTAGELTGDVADLTAAVAAPRFGPVPGSTGLAGQYFLAAQGLVSTYQMISSNGILYLHAMYLPASVTVDRVAIEVTAPGTGVVRHGVYANDPATGLPASNGPIADYGTVDVTAVGVKETTLNPPVLLPAGWHWYGWVWQGSNTTPPTMRTLNTGAAYGPFNIGSSLSLMAGSRLGYFVNPVNGPLGSFTASPNAAHQLTAPRVAYRRV